MNTTTNLSAGPSRKVELAGRPSLELPSAITQQVSMAAMFATPVAEARKLVPGKSLKVVEAYPGTSLLCIACTEHTRVAGLQPYREVSLLVPVRYSPRVGVPLLPLIAPKYFQDAGYFVHRLLVTSREALDLGVQVQGTQSTLADIRFDEQPFWRRCTVTVDDKHLLTLDVRKARARATTLTTYTYTLLDGQIMRTPVPLRGELGLRRGTGAAKLTLGEHYIANELRALKLGASPMLATYSPTMESVLAAPDRALAP
jgi:hypothetical protein